MKSEEAVRYPQLNAVRDELNRLKIMWIVCCGSPIIYLFAARLIIDNCFAAPSAHGFGGLSEATFNKVLIGFGVVAVAIQGALLLIRRFYNRKMLAMPRDLTALFRVYLRRTCTLIAASEFAIILGFILFLIQGRLDVLFGFSILGMIYYAQSYPSESGLGALTQPR